MLPIESNNLGKAAIREVISLAVSILGSESLVFKEGLSGAVFRGFRIMVLEWDIDLVLEMEMMVSVALKVTCLWDFSCIVSVYNCADVFLFGKLNCRMSTLSPAT